MSTKELNEELSKLITNVYEALQVAEDFADTHKLSFHFCPDSGMGGYYEGGDGEEGGWNPSSQSC